MKPWRGSYPSTVFPFKEEKVRSRDKGIQCYLVSHGDAQGLPPSQRAPQPSPILLSSSIRLKQQYGREFGAQMQDAIDRQIKEETPNLKNSSRCLPVEVRQVGPQGHGANRREGPAGVAAVLYLPLGDPPQEASVGYELLEPHVLQASPCLSTGNRS